VWNANFLVVQFSDALQNTAAKLSQGEKLSALMNLYGGLLLTLP